MPTQSQKTLPPGDVEISFTGLCLLVSRNPGGEVDVFLVEDAQHVSRIYVRTPGGAAPCDFGFGSDGDLKGELDLTFLAPPTNAATTLPNEIANITLCTGQKLDQNVDKQRAPNGLFRARVKLPPGQFSAFSYGHWTYSGIFDQELAYCAIWLIKSCNQVDKLKATLEALIGSPLSLVQSNGVYRLLIVNIPGAELPGAPASTVTIDPGDNAMHFDMFKMLLTQCSTPQLPQWIGGHEEVQSINVCLGERPHQTGLRTATPKIGSFIRCMIAQASS